MEGIIRLEKSGGRRGNRLPGFPPPGDARLRNDTQPPRSSGCPEGLPDREFRLPRAGLHEPDGLELLGACLILICWSASVSPVGGRCVTPAPFRRGWFSFSPALRLGGSTTKRVGAHEQRRASASPFHAHVLPLPPALLVFPCVEGMSCLLVETQLAPDCIQTPVVLPVRESSSPEILLYERVHTAPSEARTEYLGQGDIVVDSRLAFRVFPLKCTPAFEPCSHVRGTDDCLRPGGQAPHCNIQRDIAASRPHSISTPMQMAGLQWQGVPFESSD